MGGIRWRQEVSESKDECVNRASYRDLTRYGKWEIEEIAGFWNADVRAERGIEAAGISWSVYRGKAIEASPINCGNYSEDGDQVGQSSQRDRREPTIRVDSSEKRVTILPVVVSSAILPLKICNF
jgi:hypothetical protein